MKIHNLVHRWIVCGNCKSVHHDPFPICRKCGNLLDQELYLERGLEKEMITADHVAIGLAAGKRYVRVIQGFGKIVFTKEEQEFIVRREEDGEVLFTGESEGEIAQLVNEHLGDSLPEGIEEPPPLPPAPNSNTNTKVEKEPKGEGEQKAEKKEKEKAPKEPKRKGYRAKVFDHSVTAIIRWLGKHDFSEEETYAALKEQLGENLPATNTVKIQLSWGKGGKKPIPELTEEQRAILLKHKQ